MNVALRSGGDLGLDVALLASYDGLAGGEIGGMPWEHKEWNLTLAENVRNGILEPLYYWQLEHQMLVNNCLEAIFTCSDGGEVNLITMTYTSVPERRAQLIAGWAQFIIDLDAHEVKAKQEVITAAAAEAFPVITFQVTGTELTSNIDQVLPMIRDRAQFEMKRVLETDQDFANKDLLNKDTKKARAAIKETVAKAEGEFVSYSEFAAIASQLDDVLQKMQSHGEKQVKQAKDAKKKAIEDSGHLARNILINECNSKIAPMELQNIVDGLSPDFKTAMKNKRTIESLQCAVDDEVAKMKIVATEAMARITPNLEYLNKTAAGFEFLFSDIQQHVNQEAEPFQAIVKSRIADHKEAEAKRQAELETQRQADLVATKPAAEKPELGVVNNLNQALNTAAPQESVFKEDDNDKEKLSVLLFQLKEIQFPECVNAMHFDLVSECRNAISDMTEMVDSAIKKNNAAA